jgi:hypothetical protein
MDHQHIPPCATEEFDECAIMLSVQLLVWYQTCKSG